MSWSLRIARVFGIDVRVHLSFVLVLGLGAFYWGSGHGARGALFGAFTMCCLFACVTLHELGHSLVARRFGVLVKEIVLLPIGGVARLTSEPEKPWHELLIAVAGPAVNVLIAIALFLLAFVTLGPTWLSDEWLALSLSGAPGVTTLLAVLLWANLMLAVFNMIPALPMDGGRVFRALLAMFLGKRRATGIAARVGQVLALGLGVFALLHGDAILAVISAFVFMAAGQERWMTETSALLARIRAREICDPNALTLSPGDTLEEVLGLLLRGQQAYFAVLHGERIVGTLSRSSAIAAARQGGFNAYVAAVMTRELPEVDAELSLDQVRQRLMQLGGKPVLVRGHEGILGVVGLDDLTRVAAVAATLETENARTQAARRPDLL